MNKKKLKARKKWRNKHVAVWASPNNKKDLDLLNRYAMENGADVGSFDYEDGRIPAIRFNNGEYQNYGDKEHYEEEWMRSRQPLDGVINIGNFLVPSNTKDKKAPPRKIIIL